MNREAQIATMLTVGFAVALLGWAMLHLSSPTHHPNKDNRRGSRTRLRSWLVATRDKLLKARSYGTDTGNTRARAFAVGSPPGYRVTRLSRSCAEVRSRSLSFCPGAPLSQRAPAFPFQRGSHSSEAEANMADDIRLSPKTLQMALEIAKAERRFLSDLVEAAVVEYLRSCSHFKVDAGQRAQRPADETIIQASAFRRQASLAMPASIATSR